MKYILNPPRPKAAPPASFLLLPAGLRAMKTRQLLWVLCLGAPWTT